MVGGGGGRASGIPGSACSHRHGPRGPFLPGPPWQLGPSLSRDELRHPVLSLVYHIQWPGPGSRRLLGAMRCAAPCELILDQPHQGSAMEK